MNFYILIVVIIILIILFFVLRSKLFPPSPFLGKWGNAEIISRLNGYFVLMPNRNPYPATIKGNNINVGRHTGVFSNDQIHWSNNIVWTKNK